MGAEQSFDERRSVRRAGERVSTLKRLVLAWLFGVLILSIVAFQKSVPVEMLFLDASVAGGGHWYSGLVTSIAVFFWTVAVVSLTAVAYTSSLAGRQAAARSFGYCAVIVLVLLLDDLFQLHSSVVPSVLGGPKWGLIIAEGTAVVGWLIRWRSQIVRTRWELLAAAGLGFALSLGIDRYAIFNARWSLVAEDGAKLLGVLSLALWAVSTGSDLIASVVRPIRSEGAAPLVGEDPKPLVAAEASASPS